MILLLWGNCVICFSVTAENRDLRQGGLRICMALVIFLGMTEFRLVLSPLLSTGGIFIYLLFIWGMFISDHLHGLIIILPRDLLGRTKQRVASAFFRFAYCFLCLSSPSLLFCIYWYTWKLLFKKKKRRGRGRSLDCDRRIK